MGILPSEFQTQATVCSGDDDGSHPAEHTSNTRAADGMRLISCPLLADSYILKQMDADDAELLERLSSSDRSALSGLASRYLDFVYSAARRRVGDVHLAEDVTQAVFVLLTQKAGRLRRDVVLAGWLYQTTAYVAANAMRQRQRRQHHERIAAAGRSEQAMPPQDPPDPLALKRLEAAVMLLNSSNRDALLLRFFQRKSFAEVAGVLGISEDAAKKRVARAIEQLRYALGERGRLRAAPPAASVIALCASVPPETATTALSAAIASGAANPAIQSLTKGVTLMMMSKQIGAAAAVALLVLLGGSATLYLLSQREEPTEAFAAAPATEPSDEAPEGGRLIAKVPRGEIQLIAIGSPADGRWWSPSGDRLIDPPVEKLDAVISPETGRMTRAFVLNTGFVDNENGSPTSTIDLVGASAEANLKVSNVARELVRIAVGNVRPDQPATLNVHVATGPWETIAQFKTDAIHLAAGATVKLHSIVKGDRSGADVCIISDATGDLRASAFDHDGGRHEMWVVETTEPWATTPDKPWTVRFHSRDIGPDDVAEVLVQQRPFDCKVEFSGLATDARKPSQPRVVVTTPTTQPSPAAHFPR